MISDGGGIPFHVITTAANVNDVTRTLDLVDGIPSVAGRVGRRRDLDVPLRPRPDPVALDEDSHWEILHQCLTDTAMPLDIRTAGAILLLFGQEITRIAALPAAAVTVANGDTVLLLDRVPLLLPDPLGLLLTAFADRPRPTGWAANHPNPWHFPSAEPGRHITGSTLARRLTAHGIPNRPARAGALVQLAQDMPRPSSPPCSAST
ncbi:hypothetical protein [Kitasatospora cheerisanensis]|uniref:hypothetical protein n=1 Tax=Kitasatospora cheerisanensis TaxID=81942 RepID=UPI0005688B93|nr:hypothetical protein [Kitasatospora cheerisanensis]